MPGRAPWAADGIDEASDLSVLANNYMDEARARSAASRARNPGHTEHGAWR